MDNQLSNIGIVRESRNDENRTPIVPEHIKQYKENMIGVISDVRFPRKGTKYSEAGLDFAKWARDIDPSIPILLQSTQKENEVMANEVKADFLHKN